MKSTDLEWEKWGEQDPYFGVLTAPRFRRSEITDDARQEFFMSGRWHVDYVLGTLRRRIDPAFAPQRVLDFGCGVGRVVMPFAEEAQDVVGVDIARSMLAQARQNCDERGLTNVSLVMSDDQLSAVEGQFDLVHSCIVLQHLEIARGRALFAKLVDRVRPGGCGALQITFAWDVHAATFGQPPLPLPPPPAASGPLVYAKAKLRRWLGHSPPPPRPEPPCSDPEMQMNFYNLSELTFVLQRAGVSWVHTELTDHGGALGAFLFFQKPAAAG